MGLLVVGLVGLAIAIIQSQPASTVVLLNANLSRFTTELGPADRMVLSRSVMPTAPSAPVNTLSLE